MTKVSNCGHDERGLWSGGKAGDQTGTEYRLCEWFDFGQNVVLRHPSKRVRRKLARMAKNAAKNDRIGYDQSQRRTFWDTLKKCAYKPKRVRTACEADCSSSTAAIVKACGYQLGLEKLKAVSPDCWTGNLRAALVKAGFAPLTSSKYLRSGDWLLRGDISLNESRHVNIAITDGRNAKSPSKAVTAPDKGIRAVAYEVIDGKWGDGDERVRRLRAAGYDSAKVQAEVNRLLG